MSTALPLDGVTVVSLEHKLLRTSPTQPLRAG